MKNKHLYKACFAAALIGVSLSLSSCGKDDDSSSSNSNGNTQEQTTDTEEKLVSELKCTVSEFATKYTTLKKGEKVSVTLTDVSDNNIAQVAAILQKMSGSKLSKAGGDGYIVVLVMESKDELTKIPANIFKDCTAIVAVSIPECVELIESGAFDGCTALEAVKILSEVAVIQDGAFAEDVNVVGGTQSEVVVAVPDKELLSPADIVDYVKASKEAIVTLNMPLETYDHTEVMMAIDKITDKKVKLVIPEGVKELSYIEGKMPKNDYDFPIYPQPSALESVVIPNSVTEIGESAFSSSGLTNLVIPGSVNFLGGNSFGGCQSLVNVTISDGVKEIGSRAFCFCESLTSITIPGSVAKVFYNAFEDSGLKNLDMPKSVKNWGDYFFQNGHLVNITIPDGVSMIDNGAFQQCINLESVSIPASVTVIGESAFGLCYSLSAIAIPETVTKIGNSAFWSCTSLTSVTIPGSVSEIEDWLFGGCENLTSVTLSEGITKIGDWVFNHSTKLPSLSIPNSVTELGNGIFNGTIYCSKAIYDQYHDEYSQMVVKE